MAYLRRNNLWDTQGPYPYYGKRLKAGEGSDLCQSVGGV